MIFVLFVYQLFGTENIVHEVHILVRGVFTRLDDEYSIRDVLDFIVLFQNSVDVAEG